MPYKILITGASTGIGRATALELLKKGHEVLIVARREDKLLEIQRQSQAFEPNLQIGCVDVTDAKSIESFLKTHHNFLSNIDVLINNAGLALGREAFQDAQMSDIETMLQTNVMGLLRLTRALLPGMIAKRFGHVVNMGSVAGNQSYNSGTVYCATKAAVHMITDCLRLDLAGSGVRVSTIAPGRVAETEFSAIRYKGNLEKAKSVYEGFRVMTATDVALAITWVIEQPPHVNIQELVMLSTDQPDARSVHAVRAK